MSEEFNRVTESSLVDIDDALGKIIPMGPYLLIRPEKPKNKTKSGIVLPDSIKIFTYRGRVLEISPILKAHYEKEDVDLEARIGKNDFVIFRFTGGEAVSGSCAWRRRCRD